MGVIVNMLDNLLVNKPSRKGQMSKEDWIAAGKQALLFLGPALLVLIASTVEIIPSDWKYGALTLFALNRVYDLLLRFLKDNGKKK